MLRIMGFRKRISKCSLHYSFNIFACMKKFCNKSLEETVDGKLAKLPTLPLVTGSLVHEELQLCG